jgi:signal transduction histidine kinase
MRSLRNRLTFTHMLVALVAVAVVAGLATFLIQRGFDNLADRQAQQEANDAAEQLSDYYDRRGNWRGIDSFLRRRFPLLQPGTLAQRRQMQLLDAQGSVIFDSAVLLSSRRVTPIQSEMRAPVTVGETIVGTVLVSSARDQLSQAERDFLIRVRLSVLIGSITALVVALVAGLVSAAQVTGPLRTLTVAARRLASGARHEALPMPVDRELADLATAFNTMAAQLELQEDLRRQQVADIAHELRTPLSVLRLQLESLEDGVEQPTPALLESLTEEVGLLTRLVDDLRLISLADAGQLTLNLEQLDVGDTLRQAAASAAARARQQQITLNTNLPSTPLTIIADPQRMAQILGNLIENAIRYTPSGGMITLAAIGSMDAIDRVHTPAPDRVQTPNRGPTQQMAGMVVVFSVRDTGPGIPPADLARLFERFWRADRARARETGGSGLGLAIVKRLVDLQGGRVWATSQVGQGTTIHVALPRNLI